MSIISAAVVVSVFAVGLYNGIDRRVLQLEGAQGEVEKHFVCVIHQFLDGNSGLGDQPYPPENPRY